MLSEVGASNRLSARTEASVSDMVKLLVVLTVLAGLYVAAHSYPDGNKGTKGGKPLKDESSKKNVDVDATQKRSSQEGNIGRNGESSYAQDETSKEDGQNHDEVKTIVVTKKYSKPYPAEIEKKVPYEVKVPVDRPYPVYIPQPYPVYIEKKVPFEVKVPVPQPFTIEKNVHYDMKAPLDKQYQFGRAGPEKHYSTYYEKKIPYTLEKPLSYSMKVSTHKICTVYCTLKQFDEVFSKCRKINSAILLTFLSGHQDLFLFSIHSTLNEQKIQIIYTIISLFER